MSTLHGKGRANEDLSFVSCTAEAFAVIVSQLAARRHARTWAEYLQCLEANLVYELAWAGKT